MHRAPGWYPDPDAKRGRGQDRYWNGREWTALTRPTPAAERPRAKRGKPDPAPKGSTAAPLEPAKPSWFWRHKILSGALAIFLLLWLAGLTGGDEMEGPATTVVAPEETTSTSPEEEEDAASGDDGESSPKEKRGGTPKSNSTDKAEAIPSDKRRTTKPRSAPPPRVKRPAQKTFLVTRVIDGDTIELGNGESVRLVGIDTPEVGQCGADRATANLERLVLGKQVRLMLSDEDRDRYGRLLRYVDVGGQDAGLRLIKNGFAIARYDSRDGYGYHQREPRYIAADRASGNFRCPKPAPPPKTLVGGGNCAAGYKPCIPPYPPDLDCADVDGPIYVTGSDPHELDAEADGVGCE